MPKVTTSSSPHLLTPFTTPGVFHKSSAAQHRLVQRAAGALQSPLVRLRFDGEQCAASGERRPALVGRQSAERGHPALVGGEQPELEQRDDGERLRSLSNVQSELVAVAAGLVLATQQPDRHDERHAARPVERTAIVR